RPEVAESVPVEAREAAGGSQPEEPVRVGEDAVDAIARQSVRGRIRLQRKLLGPSDAAREREREAGGEETGLQGPSVAGRLSRLGPVRRAVDGSFPDGHLGDARPAERPRGLQALGKVASEVLRRGVATSKVAVLVDVAVVELPRDRLEGRLRGDEVD